MDTSGFVFSPKRFGRSASACVYVAGNPNGTVRAPLGTLADNVATGDLYRNTDGGTTWILFSAAGTAAAAAVTAGANIEIAAQVVSVNPNMTALQSVKIGHPPGTPTSGVILTAYDRSVGGTGGNGCDIENLGTFDCTAADRTGYGVYIGAYPGRSAGAFNVTAMGLEIDAIEQTGVGTSIALQTDRGNVKLCTVNGTCTIDGNTIVRQQTFVADRASLYAYNSPVAGAGNSLALDGQAFGTLDATAAARQNVGVNANAYATRSAGANNLTNIGLHVGASGGQINYAIRTTAGDVSLCATGGVDKLGFFGTAPVTKRTGVAVTAAAIHAALVAYGIIGV